MRTIALMIGLAMAFLCACAPGAKDSNESMGAQAPAQSGAADSNVPDSSAQAQSGTLDERLAKTLTALEPLARALPAETDVSRAAFQLMRYTLEPDGGVVAYTGLYLGQTCVSQARFVLAPNPNAGAEGQTPYAVKVAELAETHGNVWQRLDTAGASVQADLDGDGVEETIGCTVGKEDSVELTIAHGGETHVDSIEYFYNPHLYLADTRTGDGLKELYCYGDVGSDDYMTRVYRLIDGDVQVTELPGEVEYVDGQGNARVVTGVDALGSWGGACAYALGDDFTFARASDYAIVQYPGMRMDRGLITKRDGLPAQSADGGARPPLAAATRLLPISMDLASYAVCELDEGSLVRIALTENTEDWGWRIDKLSEGDWFVELMYAG